MTRKRITVSLLVSALAIATWLPNTGCTFTTRTCGEDYVDAMRDEASDALDCPEDDIGYGGGFVGDGNHWAEGCGRVAYFSCSSRRSCMRCSLSRVVQY